MIDREVYFEHVRNTLFDGSMQQVQVDGQSVLLALWDWQATGSPMTDIRWLAYIFATVYHECAKRMWPIEEYGQGGDQDYAKIDPETGQGYWGRGFVMLTHKANYDKASKALSLIDERDLVWHPNVALDSLISARILFRGMSEGWYTGHKLGDYFDDHTDDPINARKIVNALDKAELIADYHYMFLDALEAAKYERRLGT